MQSSLAGDRESRLLENNSILARSIRLRNPYVDPMSIMQAAMLKRKRAGESSPILTTCWVLRSTVLPQACATQAEEQLLAFWREEQSHALLEMAPALMCVVQENSMEYQARGAQKQWLWSFMLEIFGLSFNANFLVVTDFPKRLVERTVIVFFPFQRKNAPLRVGRVDVPNVLLSFKITAGSSFPSQMIVIHV